MSNQQHQNPYFQNEMKEYFSSLPKIVQESIEQSGVEFKTLEELKSFVSNIYS